VDAAAYRAELEKLERALSWPPKRPGAARGLRKKSRKKQKERSDLIDATRTAFLFTFVAHEPRGDRMLSKYRMVPNPAYKATSRSTSMFSKVRGYLWIDEDAAQLARAELEVTGRYFARRLFGQSVQRQHLMQERYEMAPGLWFATYSQYDFDGRRLFMSFGLHERTSIRSTGVSAPKGSAASHSCRIRQSTTADVFP